MCKVHNAMRNPKPRWPPVCEARMMLHQFSPFVSFPAVAAWLLRQRGACCLLRCLWLSCRSVLMGLTDPVRHLQAFGFLVQRAALTGLMESSADAFTLFAPDDKVSASTDTELSECLCAEQDSGRTEWLVLAPTRVLLWTTQQRPSLCTDACRLVQVTLNMCACAAFVLTLCRPWQL